MTNEHCIGDLIYLCIPQEWVTTYYKLLYLLSCNGKNIIDDCNYACKNKGKNVFTCWNLFQSALAAKALGEDKKANLFIDYINGQLDIYAKMDDITIPEIDDDYPVCLYSIDEFGVYRFMIKVKIKGEEYVNEFSIPSGIFFYGAANTASVDELDTSKLVETDTLNDKTLTITTTEDNPYVWFVSPIKLVIYQAGFILDLEEEFKNNNYYYHTDALQSSDDNVFTIKEK